MQETCEKTKNALSLLRMLFLLIKNGYCLLFFRPQLKWLHQKGHLSFTTLQTIPPHPIFCLLCISLPLEKKLPKSSDLLSSSQV